MTVALRILLEADRKYEEAFDLFLRLEDLDVFRFIDQHYLHSQEWVQTSVLKLMELSSEKCVKLLISQREEFPIRNVVDLLREKSHFLHEYLHNLYISDSERLPPEYHDLQVVLYANYDRSKLMEFLKTSPHYEERDALEVAEAKGF